MPEWAVLLYHQTLADAGALWYRYPSRSMVVIGVTGTSGKTTTAHLIYHLLKQAGFKVELISTISVPGLHVTNPDPFPLQKMLRRLADKGVKCLVLEVTSHGLDQWRCWGIGFDYGVLTNITHEHLDYHRTFNHYRQAKLKLIRSAKISVLNRNDPSFKLAQASAGGRMVTFTDRPDFMAANVNAAAAVALDLGISSQEIKAALVSFPGIPGRMEVVREKPFKIVIDFAHKPDALEKALKFLRYSLKGRIIAVFGCAGLRDWQKRPLMGAISARLAEITILTAEDPRTEDVNKIIEAITTGWRGEKKPKNHRLLIEPDRQKAINLAIKLARPGDMVGLFGKSHEKSMCFGTIEYSWNEYQAVKKALKLCNY